MMLRLLILTITLLLSTPAWAIRDWYVDNSGSPACDPNGAATAGDPLCKIQRAVDLAGDGDTILVQDGTYTGYQTVGGSACNNTDQTGCISPTSVGVVIHLVGIDTKPNLTIQAESAATILDGNDSGVLMAAFAVSDSNNIIIDGFTIRDFSVWDEHGVNTGGDENLGAIILDSGCTGGIVRNNVITGSDPGGNANAFAADINLVTVASGLTIQDNYVDTNMRIAVSFHRTSAPAVSINGTITGNYITQNKDNGNPRGNFYRAILVDKSSDVVVSNNYIENTDSAKLSSSQGIFLRDQNSSTVEGNVIRGYGTGIVIQDSSVAGAGAGNINDNEQHIIVNNTIDSMAKSNTEAGVDTESGNYHGCDNCIMRNNIIMHNFRGFKLFNNHDPNDQGGTTWGANIIYDPGDGTRCLQAQSQPDPNNLIPDDTINEGDNKCNTAASPVVEGHDPNGVSTLPTAAQWFARAIGEETDSGTNYHVDPNVAGGSTAVDFGNAASCPAGWPTSGAACDIGAYELNPSAPATSRRIIITSMVARPERGP